MANRQIPDDDQPQQQTLQSVMRAIEPLLELLVAKGVSYQMLDEAIKLALVKVAINQHPDGGEATGTQLSLLTGLNRKEIKRLTTYDQGGTTTMSRAAVVFMTWRTMKPWVDVKGKPRVLSRGTSAANSNQLFFDDLVRSITVDHRPKAVLDELLRLKMVSVNEHEIAIIADVFLTNQTFNDALIPLVENLTDHAKAAVHNVLDGYPKMLERSLLAKYFSEASVAALQAAAQSHWLRVHDHLAHLGNALEEGDKQSDSVRDQRIRIGMYVFHEQMVTDSGVPENPLVIKDVEVATTRNKLKVKKPIE